MNIIAELLGSALRPENSEEPLERDLPIVDAHQHFWDVDGARYQPEDLVAEVIGGHNIVATIFTESQIRYRSDGPEHMRSLGETEYAVGIAEEFANGARGVSTRICAGILAQADLRLGTAVDEVLEGHRRIAGDRLKGVRKIAYWDPDPAFNCAPFGEDRPGILLEPSFQQGFSRLSQFGLSFDVCVFHHQLGDVECLAKRFPDTPIIVGHVGNPLGLREYAGKQDAVFAQWVKSLRSLAGCENVYMKLGGMGVPHLGLEYQQGRQPVGSKTLAAQWRPYIETCVELFGSNRCMFESNAPLDMLSCSYNSVWNAFKLVCGNASADDKANLFHATAATVYRLDV